MNALKQINSGISTYKKIFNFENQQLDTNYWKGELVQYFIEKNSYSPEHSKLLKELQHISLENINVSFNGSVDVYCYTSNLTDYNFELVEEGVYTDALNSNVTNFIYTRSYILNKLKAEESILPDYEELSELQSLEDTLQKYIC